MELVLQADVGPDIVVERLFVFGLAVHGIDVDEDAVLVDPVVVQRQRVRIDHPGEGVGEIRIQPVIDGLEAFERSVKLRLEAVIICPGHDDIHVIVPGNEPLVPNGSQQGSAVE